MTAALEEILACPVCGTALALSTDDDGGVLHCAQGHRFDAARQGYFNLLTGKGTSLQPDTASMVQARIDFLSRGHYDALVEAVCAAAQEHSAPDPVILDAGAGTGFYLAALRNRLPSSTGIAIDISKYALRRATALLPGMPCLVWDVWRRLPLQDGSVDVILNIFAPRNPGEFHRVLGETGTLIVVTPLAAHLSEVAEVAGLLEIQPDKHDAVAAGLAGTFQELGSSTVEFSMRLSSEDIADVAGMGPAGHHRPRPDPRVLPTDVLVTGAFTVQAFRPLAADRVRILPNG
ncbi:23S rRNA (guanine745-N1)-methyltransferase [Arthrobacter pigmenti]|uniref:23S rRNA (Guanine745-N1)-methyltransferase n=1 Tax=Arthrobacter pigmenti TaxID=271432 RepID=A0A846RL31_9MICC|nr:methyltransferase domain-containing protein [Arthrobacter pigmenti]NJC22380.1 23S rRNA (guanine745-N1)-methyltransferase [Arthrobacter pigmenti]